MGVLGVIAVLALATGLGGEPVPRAAPDTGTLHVRIPAGPGGESYAAFLPPGYDPGRKWPALVLMDPRGRAVVPLEIFRGAAAERGYVLLSSYDTSSDEETSGEDSRRGVEALVNDAVERFALDTRRLYPTGFSGTARLAVTLAASNPGLFPAVVGFGGGVAPDLAAMFVAGMVEAPAFFGGAGTGDFNYGEMWRTDAALTRAGKPFALMYFPGGHGWPPAEVAQASVEWLELVAQGSGLAPPDTAWIRERLDRHLATVRALASQGREHDAVLVARRVLPVMAPFRPFLGDALAEGDALLERLLRGAPVTRATTALDHWLDWERERRSRFDVVREAFGRSQLPSVGRLAGRLDIEGLRGQAAEADTLAAQAAGRTLAVFTVWAAFYMPRQFLAAGDTARAVRSLELALLIAPETSGICFRFRTLEPADRARSAALSEACRDP